jgi:predicted DsbA family dithiol-disulfide isomerase
MNSIIIIGVNPPCPRCKLLGNVIDAKVKELQIDAEVKHIAYTDAEAIELAQSFGLEAGTAKDVSRKIHLEIDSQRISGAQYNKTIHPDFEFESYNDCNWTFELDEILRLFEHQAKEAGIMMTPVLIINGELKHQGSVPALSKINKWLLELK